MTDRALTETERKAIELVLYGGARTKLLPTDIRLYAALLHAEDERLAWQRRYAAAEQRIAELEAQHRPCTIDCDYCRERLLEDELEAEEA